MHLLRPLIASLFLAGCVANGVAEDPLTRRFQWPEIMAGNDIHRSCVPGAPEHWRFVYNGVYEEQVRVYEIEAGFLEARVFDRPNLAFIGSADVDQFMHGSRSRTEIGREDIERLSRAWESDMPKAARPGDILRSDRFFWTAATCREGRFTVAAFPYPSDGTSPFAFPEQLARFDRTDKLMNPPRAIERDVGARADFVPGPHSGDTGMRFLLGITPEGIQPEY